MAKQPVKGIRLRKSEADKQALAPYERRFYELTGIEFPPPQRQGVMVCRVEPCWFRSAADETGIR